MSRAVVVAFRDLPAAVRGRLGGSAPKRTKNKLAIALRQKQAEFARDSFQRMLDHAHLPTPIPELQFHDTRKWRFDYAWPSVKIALEVEGGIWTNGAHTRGAHFLSDMEKYNAAAVLGWRIVRCTPDTLTARSTERTLKALLTSNDSPSSRAPI